jgi:hypothetical protein
LVYAATRSSLMDVMLMICMSACPFRFARLIFVAGGRRLTGGSSSAGSCLDMRRPLDWQGVFNLSYRAQDGS